MQPKYGDIVTRRSARRSIFGEIPGVGTYVFDLTGYDTYDLDVFLKTGLVDPRVAGETFPLDRRTLRSEMQP